MNRALSLSASLMLAAAPVVTPRAQQSWESIGPRYQNVRGINYIATYESLTNPGNTPPGYTGVSSSTAMWRFYSEPSAKAEVVQQLDWIKGLGLNAVRVWVSFPLWLADRGNPNGNRMLTAFADFLNECEQRRIYVMPVLWDAHCTGTSPCAAPDYADPDGSSPPYNNISHWIPNPGQPKLDEFAASNFTSTEFTDYIRDVVQIGATSPAVFMWDAVNEPHIFHGDPNHLLALCEQTLARIRVHHLFSRTTIGFTSVLDSDAAAAAVRSPDLDVISIHTYGTFRENVELYVDYATQVRSSAGGELTKPVLLTEIGQPGWGQAYKDILTYTTDINWGPPSSPDQNTGIGFFLFGAMCGWNAGNFPHREKHGVFFADNQVRDIDACVAIQEIARKQGIDGTTLTQNFTRKDANATNYYPQYPLPDGHDFQDTIRTLTLPAWYYGSISPGEGATIANLLEILGYDAGVLGAGPTPVVSISIPEFQLLQLCAEVYRTGTLGGRTLSMQERNAILNAWRFTLVPYIANLTGPSTF